MPVMDRVRWIDIATVGLVLMGLGASSTIVRAQWRSIPTPPPCQGSLGVMVTAPSGRPSVLDVQLPDPPIEVDVAVITLYVRSVPAGERYIADALADHIAYQLARQPGLTTASREGIRRAPPTKPAESAETARALHARYLLSGTIHGSPRGSRLTVSLYDAKAGKNVWEQRYPMSSDRALDIARSVHASVVARVKGQDLESGSNGIQGGTTVPAAFEQFLRGLDADRERGQRYYNRAMDFFREAVRLDPQFAEAHARLGLSIAHALEAGLTDSDLMPDSLLAEGKKAADRAVAIDSSFALGWLARASLTSFPVMTMLARDAYRRAASLDPGDPEIAWREAQANLRAGRRAEGERRLQDASTMSRRFAPALTMLGALSLAAKRYDTACDWLNYAITADPYAAEPYALRSAARRRYGELRLAWTDAEIASRLGSRLLGDAAASLVDLTARDSSKARARARWVTRELDRRTRISQLEARYLAILFLGLGDRERALRAVDKAYPRDRHLGLLLQDDFFKPLARDRRFRRATGLTS